MATLRCADEMPSLIGPGLKGVHLHPVMAVRATTGPALGVVLDLALLGVVVTIPGVTLGL